VSDCGLVVSRRDDCRSDHLGQIRSDRIRLTPRRLRSGLPLAGDRTLVATPGGRRRPSHPSLVATARHTSVDAEPPHRSALASGGRPVPACRAARARGVSPVVSPLGGRRRLFSARLRRIRIHALTPNHRVLVSRRCSVSKLFRNCSETLPNSCQQQDSEHSVVNAGCSRENGNNKAISVDNTQHDTQHCLSREFSSLYRNVEGHIIADEMHLSR
jgi:hypothetical protein